MPVTSTIKQNDTSPPFTATLRDGDGEVVDISGATVKFLMRNRLTRALKVDGVASVVSGSGGTISYTWASGDTDTPGTYEVEIEITFSDETVATWPSDGYHELSVLDDLG